jgi:hypothetical protein
MLNGPTYTQEDYGIPLIPLYAAGLAGMSLLAGGVIMEQDEAALQRSIEEGPGGGTISGKSVADVERQMAEGQSGEQILTKEQHKKYVETTEVERDKDKTEGKKTKSGSSSSSSSTSVAPRGIAPSTARWDDWHQVHGGIRQVTGSGGGYVAHSAFAFTPFFRANNVWMYLGATALLGGAYWMWRE